MKHKEIKLGLATAAILLGNMTYAEETQSLLTEEAPTKVEWKTKQFFFGFAQIGLESGDGIKKEGDYKFQADRIRLGWKYYSGAVAAKIFLDFKLSGTETKGIGVPEVIKDAFISYKFDDALWLKAGVQKSPVGMGFTLPGWNLDVIKRGFDKKLGLERAFGIMVSGRDIGFGNNGKVNALDMGHERPWKGFGYDLMFGEQAGRSGAVINAKTGNGSSYGARVMFDWTEKLHFETSYGVSEEAGGTNGAKDLNGETIETEDREDYKVLNIGLDSHFGKANVKAEYFDSQNIRGKKGWDMNTLALTGTYYLTDTVEFAVKDIRGTETIAGVDSDAANTYIGLNFYINPKNNKMSRKAKKSRNRHRIQLNYVVADVDKSFKGAGALYKEDVILAQYQFKF